MDWNFRENQKTYGFLVILWDKKLINPLSANPTKWSNCLNCLSVFDHLVGLALEGLIQLNSADSLKNPIAKSIFCKQSNFLGSF